MEGGGGGTGASMQSSTLHAKTIRRLLRCATIHKLHPRTVHLAIHLLNGCGHMNHVDTELTCLYIASKYEDTVRIDASSFGGDDKLIKNEREVLIAVNYNLVRTTVYDILARDDARAVSVGFATLFCKNSFEDVRQAASTARRLLDAPELIRETTAIADIVTMLCSSSLPSSVPF